MPFTPQELDNIAQAALDFHFQTGIVDSQSIQNKPLLKALMPKSKSFPGGKDLITKRVKFDYTTQIQGFEHDDTVDYRNPANIKTASYPYRLIHAGITLTNHELIKDGISVVDSTTGEDTTRHTQRERTALANLLDDKLEDMKEGVERGMNNMFWDDGTADPKLVAGLSSIILDNPAAAGIVGGIDQVANPLWQNRAVLGMATANPDDQIIVNTLQREMRQLRRYGPGPNKLLAGSDWLEAFEQELRARGNYTDTGWAKEGRIDGSMADIAFKGLAIDYDPTLDDMGKSKYMYAIDCKNIYPMTVEGENMKKHNPARPHDQYVLYKAVTWVGALVAWRRNTSGVYTIA